MNPTVYIETTIPSYYSDERAELAADIARTRQWWDVERFEYECFISPAVLDELLTGAYPKKERCLQLVADIQILAADPEVIDIAEVYRANKLMPRVPSADALHVAFASYYRMDYLLTWNCQHLANARKARHLEELNMRLRLGVPRIVTPDMLRPAEEES